MRFRRWLWLAALALTGCGQLQTKTDDTTQARPKQERIPAMANTFWNSAGSTAWANAANWTAGVPNAAAVAIFDGRSQVSISGYDASGGGTVASIRIHREYSGSIGAPGNPLKLPVSAVDHLGSGQVCIELSAATVPYVSVDSKYRKPDYALQWTGFNVKHLDILRGGVWYDCPSGASATNITVYGGRFVATAATLHISQMFVYGGEATTNHQVTSTYVAGGTVIGAGNEYTNVRIMGGTYIVQNDAPSTRVWVLGGTCDISPCTSGLAITRVMIYPGADMISNAGALSGITTLRDLRNDFP